MSNESPAVPYRLMFRRAPVAMAIADAGGAVQSINDAAVDMLGWTAIDACGGSILAIVPGHRDGAERRLVSDLTLGLRDTSEVEDWFVRRDGSRLWGRATITAVRGADGGVQHLVGVIEDRTAAHEAQLELERSNAALQEFAYIASHDLSEPLRSVRGFAELLLRREPALSDESREFLGFILDGTTRLRRLVDELLAFSRVATQAKDLSACDVNELLAGVLVALRPALDDAGAIVEVVGRLPTVTADDVQLGQVFQNLIANGIKFRRTDRPCRISVTAERVAAMWRFRIGDNGIGVAAEHRERVFGMLKQLHARDEYEGSGMGLAIVRRIVERHGGRVSLEDGDDGGTAAVFTLPDVA